jgi:hypothetical protein
MMLVPAQSYRGSSIEMLNIDPLILAAAQERDAGLANAAPAKEE